MFTAMEGDRARSSLADSRFGDLRWVPETGSTNADLLAEARSGAPEGRVLVADHQAAGRGRLDRSWEAPPGSSLLCSVLVRPTLAPDQTHLLTLALGVAATDAVREVAQVGAALKWPNDLVVRTDAGERKLGGILAESVLAGGRVDAVVLGLGLNVAWGGTIPEHLAAIAVALDDLLPSPPDREDLLVGILRAFEQRYVDLDDPTGRARLLEDYLDRCVTLGRQVRVELADGSVEGRAASVLPSGHLVVDVGGQHVEVAVGDVVHLR